MKKILFFCVIVLSLIATSSYAGNGDLVVNGSVGIGVSNPQEKLEINGTAVVTLSGARFKIALINAGEDSATSWVDGNVTDTCDGNSSTQYGCPADAATTCTDTWCSADPYGDIWCSYRTLTCRRAVGFVEIP